MTGGIDRRGRRRSGGGPRLGRRRLGRAEHRPARDSQGDDGQDQSEQSETGIPLQGPQLFLGQSDRMIQIILIATLLFPTPSSHGYPFPIFGSERQAASVPRSPTVG